MLEATPGAVGDPSTSRSASSTPGATLRRSALQWSCTIPQTPPAPGRSWHTATRRTTGCSTWWATWREVRQAVQLLVILVSTCQLRLAAAATSCEATANILSSSVMQFPGEGQTHLACFECTSLSPVVLPMQRPSGRPSWKAAPYSSSAGATKPKTPGITRTTPCC